MFIMVRMLVKGAWNRHKTCMHGPVKPCVEPLGLLNPNSKHGKSKSIWSKVLVSSGNVRAWATWAPSLRRTELMMNGLRLSFELQVWRGWHSMQHNCSHCTFTALKKSWFSTLHCALALSPAPKSFLLLWGFKIFYIFLDNIWYADTDTA